MSRPVLVCLFPFFVACTTATPAIAPLRLTPIEVSGSGADDHAAGSSGLAGVHTQVLSGDPSKPGFYTILLFVPAGTTIQAHSHRDNRMATVVSGTWNFGYGDRFQESALKALPPGSVYSEPGGKTHFARTAAEPVVVELSGSGPTDTVYFDAANDPSQHRQQAALQARD
jgi:quercetin dioxygenase-like cupin family protein